MIHESMEALYGKARSTSRDNQYTMDVESPEDGGTSEQLYAYVRGIRDVLARDDVTDKAKKEEICARHVSLMMAHGFVDAGVLDTVRCCIEQTDSVAQAVSFVLETLLAYFHVDAYELMRGADDANKTMQTVHLSSSVEPCSLRDARESALDALPDHLDVDKIKWMARRVRDDERDEQDVACALAAEKDALTKFEAGTGAAATLRQMYKGGYLFEGIRSCALGKLVIEAFLRRGWSYDTAAHQWYLPTLDHLTHLYNVSTVPTSMAPSRKFAFAPAPAPEPELKPAPACKPAPELKSELKPAPACTPAPAAGAVDEVQAHNDWLRSLHEQRLERSHRKRDAR